MDLFSDSWTEKDIPDLSGKVVLVTGSTDGLGLAASKQFLMHNAHVIITYRDTGKLDGAIKELKEAAPHAKVDTIEMDLCSLRSVKEAASQFLAMNLPLHVLINNAGILVPEGERGTKTEDGFEITMASNHFGHFYLTQLLLEKLKQNSPSRIIWQSSAASNIGIIDFDDLRGEKNDGSSLVTYGTTKLMNVMTAREFQRRLGDVGVLNYVVHPGVTSTDIYNKMERGKPGTIGLEVAEKLWGQSPERGARPMLYAATAPELNDPSKAGAYFGAFLGFTNLKQTEAREPLNPLAHDPEAAARLFDETDAIIKDALQKKGLLEDPSHGNDNDAGNGNGGRPSAVRNIDTFKEVGDGGGPTAGAKGYGTGDTSDAAADAAADAAPEEGGVISADGRRGGYEAGGAVSPSAVRGFHTVQGLKAPWTGQSLAFSKPTRCMLPRPSWTAGNMLPTVPRFGPRAIHVLPIRLTTHALKLGRAMLH